LIDLKLFLRLDSIAWRKIGDKVSPADEKLKKLQRLLDSDSTLALPLSKPEQNANHDIVP
jgi:hypothetical protein